MVRRLLAVLTIAVEVAVLGACSMYDAARRSTHGVTSIPNDPGPACTTSRDVCRGGRIGQA